MNPLPSAKPKATRTKVTQTDELFSQVCRRLHEYRSAKRASRPLPRWTDIELMEIYDIAPNVMVRDAVDGGREFRCRYFGGKLVDAFGYDPTGKLMGEVYQPASVEIATERYLNGLNAMSPTRVVGYVDLVETSVPKTFESIILPLAGANEAPEYVLCAFNFAYRLRDEDFDEGPQPAAWPGIQFPVAS